MGFGEAFAAGACHGSLHLHTEEVVRVFVPGPHFSTPTKKEEVPQ